MIEANQYPESLKKKKKIFFKVLDVIMKKWDLCVCGPFLTINP